MKYVICSVCGCHCIKYGKNSSGSQRWRCPSCGTVTTPKIDRSAKQLKIFLTWLFGKQSQNEMSGGGRTFRRNTSQFWEIWPLPPLVERTNGQYYFDERCEEQIKEILRFKSFRFTLEEIELLFYYAGLTNLQDPNVIDQILQKLQEYFRTDTHRILFLACDVHQLPVRAKAVDLFIDDFSGINHAFTYNNENLYQTISPLLKDTGKAVGQYVDYTKAPKSLRNFTLDHPDFQPELMSLKRFRSGFPSAGLQLTLEINQGSPEGTQQDFLRQADHEKVSLITYLAEKKTP